MCIHFVQNFLLFIYSWMIIWKIQIQKRFRITLFITTNHNIRIFGVIPLIKLQNDTSTTVKRWKIKCRTRTLICFWVELCCFRVQCLDDPVKGSTWQTTPCTYFAYWSMWIFISGLPSTHSSGAVWESRWPSWAVRPNEPSGFRGRKSILNHASALVSACP